MTLQTFLTFLQQNQSTVVIIAVMLVVFFIALLIIKRIRRKDKFVYEKIKQSREDIRKLDKLLGELEIYFKKNE